MVEVKDCPSSHTHTTFPSSERRRKGIIPGSVCLAAFTGFHIRVCSPELRSVLLGSLECTNSAVFYMTYSQGGFLMIVLPLANRLQL